MESFPLFVGDERDLPPPGAENIGHRRLPPLLEAISEPVKSVGGDCRSGTGSRHHSEGRYGSGRSAAERSLNVGAEMREVDAMEGSVNVRLILASFFIHPIGVVFQTTRAFQNDNVLTVFAWWDTAASVPLSEKSCRVPIALNMIPRRC